MSETNGVLLDRNISKRDQENPYYPEVHAHQSIAAMQKQIDDRDEQIKGWRALVGNKEKEVDGLVKQMYDLRNKYDVQKIFVKENIQSIINELHEVNESIQPS